MENFSWAWFFVGLAVIIAGALIIVFYNKIADLILDGVKDYDKTKLIGIITVGVGFLFMTNIHVFILTWIVNLVFKK